MVSTPWPPPPVRSVHLALKLARSLTIPEDHALPFLEDMVTAAMRQLPHDDGDALTWLAQVYAHILTHPSQCRPRSR